MLKRQRERGDTLIEVLIAVAVFSAVSVGAMAIMAQGIAAAQNSLEMNLVRNQIDNQAELLRHYHAEALKTAADEDTEDTPWAQIVALAQQNATPYDSIDRFEQCRPHEPGGDIGDGLPAHAFFINPENGQIGQGDNFSAPTTFAQVRGADNVSEMIWIEAVRNTGAQNDGLNATGYYDFHIRACWDSPGARGGLMRLGTIVRLYAPNE